METSDSSGIIIFGSSRSTGNTDMEFEGDLQFGKKMESNSSRWC
jgi:hypothetical protein